MEECRSPQRGQPVLESGDADAGLAPAGAQRRVRLVAEVVADENYLRESIMNSTAKVVAGYQPIMPSFRGQMSEEQLADLIAYIKSLGKDVPLGNDMPVGNKMQELSPQRPQGSSRNSDGSKRDYE